MDYSSLFDGDGCGCSGSCDAPMEDSPVAADAPAEEAPATEESAE